LYTSLVTCSRVLRGAKGREYCVKAGGVESIYMRRSCSCTARRRSSVPHPLCGRGSVRCLFFFSSRRRHTRSKRDWSSDVCSSDLRVTDPRAHGETFARPEGWLRIGAGIRYTAADKTALNDVQMRRESRGRREDFAILRKVRKLHPWNGKGERVVRHAIKWRVLAQEVPRRVEEQIRSRHGRTARRHTEAPTPRAGSPKNFMAVSMRRSLRGEDTGVLPRVKLVPH